MNFIDLFAGAGGLSEGFIRAGFKPVAHVELDSNACDTLRTRAAYHFLVSQGKSNVYHQYLKGEITRDELWGHMPKELSDSIINKEISEETKDVIFGKIDSLLSDEKVDLLVGGPPCQAYSLVGRSRDPNGMADDQRNYLFKDYAAYLKKYEPKYFVFENVLGLLSAGNKRYFKEMIKLFEEELGYKTDFRILKSEEYGVLQKRRRVIIIGKLGTGQFKFPDLEKRPTDKFQLLGDLFGDLPALKPGGGSSFTNYQKPPSQYLQNHHLRNGVDFVSQHYTRPHNANDLKIYQKAIEAWTGKRERLKYDTLPEELKTHKNNDSFLDRYKVVDGEGCSHTMVAHIAKDGHYYIYPDINQVRSLSVREAARIQSFPDDFFFEGGRTAAFKQIGNAVPPLMAESIANSLKSMGNK